MNDIELKREKKRLYDKAWRDKNTDKVKGYNDANKDYHKVYGKGYREEIKLQFYVVYTIDNYNGKGDNYCGVTSRPDRRMTEHRCDGKLNVDDFTIVEAQVDKADALAIEREYHSRGYHGHVWRLRRAV